MESVNHALFWALVFTLSTVDRCIGQFKIIDPSSGSITHPDSEKTNVTLVQIIPLVTKNMTDLPMMSMLESVRSFDSEPVQADVKENRFVKLHIVDSSSRRNTTNRVSKLRPADTNRTNDVATSGEKNKNKLIRKASANAIKGYAKRNSQHAKADTLTATTSNNVLKEQLQPAVTTESSTRARRHKYRKFKSRCRCERIWNCARIQISVARCAPDYFMCCF
ncbi:uncharacterized protein LOC131215390 [Anopheles bellator]|uniref:uncharacterized protein LOC131215390 n=1 Tax=Anopheles bellator TaxID=139047 RepID=UPI002648ABBC|nr:uncharacterized protein LOC131215390 [Anopheles bellator]